ncbi:MAG: SusF/SusE family outer membrane protein [Prevotella sp.]|nr:SusF/SusE family outer membrane protein [Prevotella sp.]
MKKIIKSALLVLCSVCLLTACEDDRDSNPTLQKPTEGSLVLNTPAMTNAVCDLANSSVLNFTLASVPNYGAPVYTNYEMEVSLSADMSNAEVIATTPYTKIEVDAATLAATLTTMETDKGKTEADFPIEIPVYFRVRANVYQNAGSAIDGYETISNTVALNKVHLLYSLPPVTTPDNLYITGNFNGWDWNSSLTMVQCYDGANVFWHMVWIDESGIKFNAEKAWDGGEVGYAGLHSITGDLADQIVDGGGNIASSNPGWYLMIITTSVAGRDIVYDAQFNKPTVWLMGTATPGASWAELEDGCDFTVPTTKDGDFVSPAFTNDTSGDGGLRAYVKIPGFDWWKSEFMVFDKKIVYRGMGGDQDRIQGVAGQKLYLNFATETGDIK